MTKLTLILISFLAVSNVQGQKRQMDFSEPFIDLKCLSDIVKKGLKSQTWDLKQLTEKNDSCRDYISIRKFKVKNDTLIITRTEKQKRLPPIETKLTIENDSLVIVRFVPIDYTKGKIGKLLNKEELVEQPEYITIKFVYNGKRMKIDFSSEPQTN